MESAQPVPFLFKDEKKKTDIIKLIIIIILSSD